MLFIFSPPVMISEHCHPTGTKRSKMTFFGHLIICSNEKFMKVNAPSLSKYTTIFLKQYYLFTKT